MTKHFRFKQKGRDEQCEPDAMDIAAKVCNCCGVDPEAVMKAFCKPRIKVGTEWVTKGQNIVQSMNAVGGIARDIFDRLFKWLIEKWCVVKVPIHKYLSNLNSSSATRL